METLKCLKTSKNIDSGNFAVEMLWFCYISYINIIIQDYPFLPANIFFLQKNIQKIQWFVFRKVINYGLAHIQWYILSIKSG